jgi:hypothetical protein
MRVFPGFNGVMLGSRSSDISRIPTVNETLHTERYRSDILCSNLDLQTIHEAGGEAHVNSCRSWKDLWSMKNLSRWHSNRHFGRDSPRNFVESAVECFSLGYSGIADFRNRARLVRISPTCLLGCADCPRDRSTKVYFCFHHPTAHNFTYLHSLHFFRY